MERVEIPVSWVLEGHLESSALIDLDIHWVVRVIRIKDKHVRLENYTKLADKTPIVSFRASLLETFIGNIQVLWNRDSFTLDSA